ncbi:hypothetical protein OsJ_18841 [Oryza sativa Japonica Group]|uniref:Uncharacterized protein n=1 Tax=Oryza sativa subsp. japonica TaxID=39947 RepID=B9FKM8_ORYSJ|nr:hypothetical protein OsJ_18841 [Oryza sativa Japonica Group]
MRGVVGAASDAEATEAAGGGRRRPSGGGGAPVPLLDLGHHAGADEAGSGGGPRAPGVCSHALPQRNSSKQMRSMMRLRICCLLVSAGVGGITGEGNSEVVLLLQRVQAGAAEGRRERAAGHLDRLHPALPVAWPPPNPRRPLYIPYRRPCCCIPVASA